MSLVVSNDKCTGCLACMQSCPHNSIQVHLDKCGYKIPIINDETCLKCNKCIQVCPVLNNKFSFNIKEDIVCYAAIGDDRVRKKSSSGGVFPLVAENFLKEGGIVFGATIDKNFKTKHIGIDKVSKLLLLQGSKYTQSDTSNSYIQAKYYLDLGKRVLFSGTPCQIAALYNFLPRKYDNLYTIDVLCHGVLSEEYLLDYINCCEDLKEIRSIHFRDKNEGWRADTLSFENKNGQRITHHYSNSLLEQGFHKNLLLREACYDCKFANIPRSADISLGDFWEIDKFATELDDKKGTSLVLVNSKKGQELLDGIVSQCRIIKQVPEEYAVNSNRLNNKIEKPASRNRYNELLNKYSYYKGSEYVIQDKYDIGLIGCWTVENHGSNLSYYALYKIIMDLGLEPLLIERPLSSIWKPNQDFKGFKKNPYRECDQFIIYEDKIQMTELNNKCDTFLLGSDQLLYHDLYNAFDKFIDMSYINNDKKKIGFGLSLGRKKFEGTEQQRQNLSYWLKKYDFISVREDSAVAVLKQTFGVDATNVLDPVFLCDYRYYMELIEQGSIVSTKKYIACYILDPTKQKEEVIRGIAEKFSMDYHVFTDVAHKRENIENMWDIEAIDTSANEDWLRGISESEFFITDSFHGVCFAIIFRKQFICIGNYYRGIERFSSLLGQLDLLDYIVASPDDIIKSKKVFKPIDYEKVHIKLEKMKSNSMAWLKNALSSQLDKHIDVYDVINNQLYETTREQKLMSSLVNDLHIRLIKLEGLYKRIDRQEKKTDKLEQLYERIDRLEEIYTRMDTQEEKINNLEHLYERIDRLEEIYTRMDTQEEKVNNLEHLYDRIDRLEEIHTRMDTQEIKVNNLEHLYERIDRLEDVYK